MFSLPNLTQMKAFEVPNYRLVSEWTLNGYLRGSLLKIICCEESRIRYSCQMWVIDLDAQSGISISLSKCRHLVYVIGKEMMIALTSAGWIICKFIASLAFDATRRSCMRKYED